MAKWPASIDPETGYNDPPSETDKHEVKLRDGDIVVVYVCYFLLHWRFFYPTDLDGWFLG